MKTSTPPTAKLTISRETVATYRTRTGIQAGTLFPPPPLGVGGVKKA